MKWFRIRVWCMSASYTGYRQAENGQQAIDQLRAEYRRNKDDRAGWNINAVEVESPEEDEEE
jgi:hypothetical protein